MIGSVLWPLPRHLAARLSTASTRGDAHDTTAEDAVGSRLEQTRRHAEHVIRRALHEPHIRKHRARADLLQAEDREHKGVRGRGAGRLWRYRPRDGRGPARGRGAGRDGRGVPGAAPGGARELSTRLIN